VSELVDVIALRACRFEVPSHPEMCCATLTFASATIPSQKNPKKISD
jgi:hypothetical protein